MSRLVVRLLGGYRVELDGEPVYGFETDKARGLLAYLSVEADRPHRREALAGLLWPDYPEAAARNSFRQTLFRLRRALSLRGGGAPPAGAAPPFLFVTPTDIQFNAASDHSLDVAELEALARSPAGESERHPRQLLPEAYCGEFLAGFSIDSEPFQAWMLGRQEYYHRLVLDILDAQNAAFEGLGDYEQAAAAARLQLKLDPWLEEAHRRCMRALALAGRRDEALRQYDACCRTLKAELGVEPSASTQALYAAIRAGKLPAAPRPAPAARRAGAPAHEPEPRHRQGQPDEPGLAPALRARPPARLVARANELAQLSGHLDAALAGEAGVAFVSGDPGSGKTALVEAFAVSAMARHRDLLVAGARCSPGGQTDPLAPLRRLGEMLFGELANELAWRLAGTPRGGGLLGATGLALGALAEHGSGLLDTLVPAASVSRRAETAALAPFRENQRPVTPLSQGALSQGALFDQFTRTLAAIARRLPLLLLLDDLHWTDDATAAFLLYFGRELSGSRVLVLGAYRSTTISLGRRDPRSGEVSRHPLVGVIHELCSSRGEITVDLDRTDGRAFVEAYVDIEPNRLGARFRDALYAQTGGHALFTVESFRYLQGHGEIVKDEAGRWVARESLDWGALPARVEAAIAERVDRLPGPERRILSIASVQGDEFSAELVAEPAGLPFGEVIACLSGSLARQHGLVRPEGLQRLGGTQRCMYRFSHHLFRQYVYGALDPVERAQLHAAAGTALDRQAGEDPAERERVSAELAWHYEAGGLPLQAARALLDAGREAMRVSAYREAFDRFNHGLTLLVNEPRSEECARLTRLLEVARLGPQRNLAGLGDDRLQNSLARATQAWAGQAQGRPTLLMLVTEAERLIVTGQYEEALAVAERLRVEAAQAGEEDLAGLARQYFGMIHYQMGNVRESERHFDWVLAWLTPEWRAGLRAAIGMDLPALALALSALNRWLLGYGEQALARSREAMAAARAAGAPLGQAASTALGANLLHFLRADTGAVGELSEQCYRLCLEHGFGMWQVFADFLLGRVAFMRGEELAGIERMRNIAYHPGNMSMGTDFFEVVLADSCLSAAGRRAVGDGVRADLLATGMRAIEIMLGPAGLPAWLPCGQVYEAELRRLMGELLLARDGLAASGEALACFRSAMQLGREKGALAWELRTAMSLVRLWQRQVAEGAASAAGLAETRDCLAGVYAQFTEGFALPDLQDAAALIEETG